MYAALAAADDGVQLLTVAPCQGTSSAPPETLPTPNRCHSNSSLLWEPKVPPSGYDTCQPQLDLLPQDNNTYNLKKPACYVYDLPKAVSSGQQLPKWYYDVLSMDTLLGAAYPWPQEASPTSTSCAADNTPWPPAPPTLRSDSQQCQHLRHLLAWSKMPKDPGKCCNRLLARPGTGLLGKGKATAVAPPCVHHTHGGCSS